MFVFVSSRYQGWFSATARSRWRGFPAAVSWRRADNFAFIHGPLLVQSFQLSID